MGRAVARSVATVATEALSRQEVEEDRALAAALDALADDDGKTLDVLESELAAADAKTLALLEKLSEADRSLFHVPRVERS